MPGGVVLQSSRSQDQIGVQPLRCKLQRFRSCRNCATFSDFCNRPKIRSSYASSSTSLPVLSDGTSPDRARLASIIYQCHRPIEQTPARTWKVHSKTINRKEQEAAQRIVTQWRRRDVASGTCPPLLLESRQYDLPLRNGCWFKRKIKENDLPRWFHTQRLEEMADDYLRSISWNIKFRAHIADLQVVLNSCNTTTPIANLTYTFSPQFSTRPPKATSPSLRDILTSRANFPQSKEDLDSLIQETTSPSLRAVLSSGANFPQSKEDLASLIQEFRDSGKSLLRLYGDDLQKSYNDLLRKPARFPLIPPSESLRHHRDLCSIKKDALFSDIANALAPDRELEKVISVSGLWPRITPRSILRELSRNRVDTLADRMETSHHPLCSGVPQIPAISAHDRAFFATSERRTPPGSGNSVRGNSRGLFSRLASYSG
jgi:hypothetical protein